MSTTTTPAASPTATTTVVKRSRSRNYDKFNSFIVIISKCFVIDKDGKPQFVEQDNQAENVKTYGATNNAVQNLDSMLKTVLELLVEEGTKLVRMTRSKTLGVRGLLTAVNLIMSAELAEDLISAAQMTVQRYKAALADKTTKNHTQKAGLHMPVRRVANMIRAQCGMRLDKLAPIVATSILEQLCKYILSEACLVASTMKRQRITPQHILLGLQNDADMYALFLGNRGLIGHNAGVVPFIAPQLLKKKKQQLVVDA